MMRTVIIKAQHKPYRLYAVGQMSILPHVIVYRNIKFPAFMEYYALKADKPAELGQYSSILKVAL